jgi:hypothetical protein
MSARFLFLRNWKRGLYEQKKSGERDRQHMYTYRAIMIRDCVLLHIFELRICSHDTSRCPLERKCSNLCTQSRVVNRSLACSMTAAIRCTRAAPVEFSCLERRASSCLSSVRVGQKIQGPPLLASHDELLVDGV